MNALLVIFFLLREELYCMKKGVVCILGILLIVEIFLANYPSSGGIERVKIEGIRQICMFLMGLIGIFFSFFLIKERKEKRKQTSLQELCSIAILLVTAICFFFLGTYKGSLVICGLNSGIKVFEGTDYFFEFTYGKQKHYWLLMNDSQNGRRVKISIDYKTYGRLENKPEIKVTYYPYVNIIDKIEYK